MDLVAVLSRQDLMFYIGSLKTMDTIAEVENEGGSVTVHTQPLQNVRARLKRWKKNIIRNTCTTVRPSDADSVVDGGDLPTKVPSFDELSILSRSQLPQGKISFWKEFEYEQECHPFVRISGDTPISEVERVLEHDWKLNVPTIVLEVISSVRRSVFWEGHRQWSSLQEGLIEAANKTDMWIITHGLNTGVAKMLGDIVYKENQRRQAMTCYRHPKQSGPKLPKLTLMGIVNSDIIVYDDLLDGTRSLVEIENTGNRPQDQLYELNPNHTHFMIVNDQTSDRSALKSFILNLEHFLRSVPYSEEGPFVCPLSAQTEKPKLGTSDIPVIALLIGGGNKSALMVLDHLKKQIPVVVVKGSGGAADLLAFAYEEIKEQSRGTWDPDYVETFITSEISRKIAVEFEEYRENNLARNKFRDRVLECVRYSSSEDRVFLSFLDIHSHHVSLSQLDEHLLRALFKAEPRDGSDYSWYQHLQKDLRLTLDWNCPDIARTEVFAKSSTKVRIEKKIFEQALLRQDREAFVEIFLDNGFQIHRFLSEKRLTKLFEKAENPEFFRNVCLEGALGYSFSLKLDKEFLKRDLNWLINYFTKLKNFIAVQDLTSNSMGTYTSEPSIAERRAHTALIIWAVFMNRAKIAKVLWKRCDYPIHMALLISLLYFKLVTYVKEKHLSKELEDRSKEFGNMAIGLLDTSFQASNCRAFDILSEEIPDWNYKTAVELAAVGRNRRFIAHPCCQKWLTYQFYGDIRIRELKFGPFTVPPWFKVILSAFFIFPMYLWIHFKTGQKRSVIGIYDDGESDHDSDNESDGDTISQPPLSRMCSREGRQSSFPLTTLNNTVKYEELPTCTSAKKSKSWNLRRFPQVTFLQYLKPKPQPPIWTKLYVMWNAPITKFWTHQIFYIAYLTIFSLTVLWPSSGNFWLDVAVWLWTFLIHAENARVTYIQYRKYSSIPLVVRTIEFVLISLFLILFFVFRILRRNEYTPFELVLPQLYISPYTARVIMCLGLLYFYYRFIWIYFPISPTLGPLLYRIRLMVTNDFYHFLRLALLFIISSGIVIHSVIYPDYPITPELFRRVFHKAWFTLFLTPITDLEEETRCTNLYRNRTLPTDVIGKYDDYTCPNTGAWPYIMTIQYHIILKLILLTLLYALFSDTAASTSSDADAIWRYQRYHLVLDFSARMRLPAPLSIISFLISIFKIVFNGITCKYCKKPESMENAEILKQLRQTKANDSTYWRTIASQYCKKEDEKAEETSLQAKQVESIKSIGENVDFQKASLYKLKVRLSELEKIILSSKISLEEIKHSLSKEDVKISGGTTLHLLSRYSPYIDTRVQRFPLADKYVPWEALYSIYDPVVYSKPRHEYLTSIRDFVDEDLLLLREQQGQLFKSPDLKWNFVFTNVAGHTIDRTSWITKDNSESVIYKLDSAGLPVNPMGRTGLRGRGSLFRWGPNHCVVLVITRWRLRDGFLQSVQGTTSTDEQRILEFVVCREPGVRFLTLPGGFLHGSATIYEVLRKQFLTDSTETWDSAKMEKYFAEFAITKAGDFVDIVGEDAHEYDFEATTVLRGYMDDLRNTDNAWVEAEILHYHYTGSKSIDLRKVPHSRWKKVTPNLNAKMLPSHAVLLSEIQQRLENS